MRSSTTLAWPSLWNWQLEQKTSLGSLKSSLASGSPESHRTQRGGRRHQRLLLLLGVILACWHDSAASHTVVRAAFEHKAEVEGIIDFCSSREPTRLACWHGSAASHTVARAACEHEEEVEGIGDFCSSCEPSRLACWHQTRDKQGGNLTAGGESSP